MSEWTMRIAATLGLALAGAFALAAQQPTGDPVADAARKAQANKQAAKPKKVWTNDDVKTADTPPAPAPGDSAAKPAAGGDDAKADDQTGLKPEDDPKKEAYWRKKSAKLKDKLAAAEKDLDVLQRESSKEQVQYYSDPQKAMTQGYTRGDINSTNAKIDAKKKEIEGLKQQMTDLEDELRKAGGNPGWLR